MKMPERITNKSTKIIPEMRDFSYMDRLERLASFLAKQRWQGNVTVVHNMQTAFPLDAENTETVPIIGGNIVFKKIGKRTKSHKDFLFKQSERLGPGMLYHTLYMIPIPLQLSKRALLSI